MDVEEGAALLGGKGDETIPGKKDHCNPCTGGFWRYHFGSDALLGSWLLLLGSALWVWMESANLYYKDQLHHFVDSFDHEMTITSAALFTVGSAYFVYLSYPEKLQEQFEQMPGIAAKAARGELSFIERYFTGTEMLIATWSFIFAFLPFLVYGFYLIVLYPTEADGYLEVVVIILAMLLTGIWAFAAMPENIMMNEGQGSTYCHDKCLTKWWCCGGCCASEKNWKSDMLVGLWIFTVLCFLGVPYALYIIFEDPSKPFSYVDAVMMFSFVAGMGLLTYSSYPQNFGKSTAFDMLTCSKPESGSKYMFQ